MRRLIVLLLIATGSCSSGERASPFTLYRNSNLERSMRVHWGTFDAAESDPSYNLNNCTMAARLLNANMAASARAEGKEPHENVGFWCEPGKFREVGPVPGRFDAAFPTDVY